MVHSIAAALMAVASLATLPSKVEWTADYGKALAATRNDQRPLLVVLDIPSQQDAAIDESLLSTEGDQAALLASYELCHVDVSTEYGQQVAKAFGATQFPHTAIIDRTGAVVIFKKPGRIESGEWNATLTKYQTGERPVAQTAYYRGESYPEATSSSYFPAASSAQPYCPSCQRAAMGL